MKKVVAIAMALAMVAGVMTSCSNTTTNQASGTKPIIATVGDEPKTMDPAINQDAPAATYIVHAFEGLTKVAKDLSVVPGQAEAMPTKSADGLTLTYKIRSDAKWSDGKAVTAGDFVYAWQRAVNPSTASPYSYQLYYIKNAEAINGQYVGKDGKPAKVKVDAAGKPVQDKDGKYTADANGKYVSAKADGSPLWLDDLGVKATDDHTLVVTLEAPCPYFDQITAFPTLFPVRKDIVEANPDKWTLDTKTYIGNGPYKLTNWVHSQKLVFTKNENYYDKKDIVSNEIDFMLMKDNGAALAAYRNGKLNINQGLIPPDELPGLIKSGDVVVKPQLGCNYVAINCAKAPFNNEKVREAFALAVDRTYLVNSVMRNGALPASAIVPSGIPDATAGSDFRKIGGEYFDVSTSAMDANIKKAKQLLSEAGYPDGKNFPAVTYKTNVAGANVKVAEYLTNQWKKNLGINVQIVTEDFSVLIADRNNSNYTLSRDAWSGDYTDPMTFLDLFVTGSGNNDTKYSNKDYDAYIKTAKTSGDQKVRMEAMHKAEDLLIKEFGAIPLSFRTDPLLVDKNISGYVDSPLGFVYLMWASVK